MKVGIVGAGPAGLFLAQKLGEDAVVYERERRLGVKPCSWVVLSSIEDLITQDEILFKITGYRIFLDNKLIHEVHSKEPFAYIIDKPRFLERLSEGVEIKWERGVIKGDEINGVKYDVIVDARGYQALSQDTVLATQYDTTYHAEENVLNSYFYSDFVGYGWVFPGPHGARIGIGGEAPFHVLRERLNSILAGEKVGYGVARISMGGLRQGNFVGEAGGAVFPITGEGIRPSLMHAELMYRKLVGEDVDVRNSSLFRIMNAHLKVVEEARKSERPGEYVSRVFMGTLRPG
ncbi:MULTISPECIES: NAD(P)/FAD-dependent oxidoreductase [Metallosphaera]|uniref:NAD(P)/FAD-dependent oxidoreductase n=1 Tax=Metallosphaera TaxID=41980 RepID=UPI001F0541EC|nr:NAD(P)/FAD-dependent oxidoreductase [Metallosphaera sedula]MCH1772140.1 NAD(P)/FAD-dependent oxidoreductase [Metallosphaera sedula]MCP6727685.1 NAD(P)/FAD-dependent oxidoreductase [Metallosphaera sedula]